MDVRDRVGIVGKHKFYSEKKNIKMKQKEIKKKIIQFLTLFV